MEFKIGGGQMKKVKGIIGLSMSLIISLGITANVSAGTKDITGTYLKLHVASYKTSGSATTTDRSGNRWVKAWQNSYNMVYNFPILQIQAQAQLQHLFQG